jgi:beta-phosphoglucomutase
MKEFNIILFDFDGTLADTMEDNFRAWNKTFQKLFGVNIEREKYMILEGLKLDRVAINLTEEYGLKTDIKTEDIVKLKNEIYLKEHTMKFFEPVPSLIDLLKKKGRKIAIVSASPRSKLYNSVPLEFLDLFDAIVCGEDTNKGKPNPDPYIRALEILGGNTDDAVVVENAPLGIKSAKSAGIYCIAVTNTLDKEQLRGADKILHIDELENFLLNNLEQY